MRAADDYGLLDRFIHYVAFGIPGLQRVAASMCEDMHRSTVADLKLGRPVFVTALPRAGTTLILELLYQTGEFASFTYRQMPFVTAPLLWHRVTGSHQAEGEKRERAHGDGMQVSFDSPEAFEEVFWLAFLRRKVVDKYSLHPVEADDLTREFIAAYRHLIKRLVYLHREKLGRPVSRYLSKNNANFTRLGALKKLCPDAVVIVPFREPLSHIGSLVRQHSRFVAEHARSKFAHRYMRWIGHYEFGAEFRPFALGSQTKSYMAKVEPDTAFWLSYWCDCYEHCLRSAPDNVVFVNYDRLVQDPARSLSLLARETGLADESALVAAGAEVRAPLSEPAGTEELRTDVLARAENVLAALQARSLNR